MPWGKVIDFTVGVLYFPYIRFWTPMTSYVLVVECSIPINHITLNILWSCMGSIWWQNWSFDLSTFVYYTWLPPFSHHHIVGGSTSLNVNGLCDPLLVDVRTTCHRYSAKPKPSIMGQLPKERVTQTLSSTAWESITQVRCSPSMPTSGSQLLWMPISAFLYHSPSSPCI